VRRAIAAAALVNNILSGWLDLKGYRNSNGVYKPTFIYSLSFTLLTRPIPPPEVTTRYHPPTSLTNAHPQPRLRSISRDKSRNPIHDVYAKWTLMKPPYTCICDVGPSRLHWPSCTRSARLARYMTSNMPGHHAAHTRTVSDDRVFVAKLSVPRMFNLERYGVSCKMIEWLRSGRDVD
jgi:hypothetical protein